MKFEDAGNNAIKIIEFLGTTTLKPDEKVAALDSASAIIRSVLCAELMAESFKNFYIGGKK